MPADTSSDKPQQQFLITVQRMCTSDEADLVSGWSGVVAAENLDGRILMPAAELTALSIKDCPVTNMRPMTLEEINTWREEQKGPDDGED